MSKPPQETIRCPSSIIDNPKPVSTYQQFAPAGAGDFVTNVSQGSEFVQKYQTPDYVLVDITDAAKAKGVPVGGPTLAVFKKA